MSTNIIEREPCCDEVITPKVTAEGVAVANKEFRTGHVVLIGEPNVGKSSLVNKIVGEQVSVVTDVPGTTREQIRGIKSTDEYQIIFLDTPGMYKGRTSLDRYMAKCISCSMAEANVIVYVLDATDIKDEFIQKIKNYKKTEKPLILVINKTDRTSYEKLYPQLAKLSGITFIKEIIPTSCKSGENIRLLEHEISKYLPMAPPIHDQDFYTMTDVRRISEEIIRGELLKVLRAELPHGIAVNVVKWKDTDKETKIDVEIYCLKQSHKPIIIGKKGAVLKKIGIESRKQIEKMLGKHVKLYTHVLVRENWKDKKDMLEKLGYTS